MVGPSDTKNYVAKWHQFGLFAAHITNVATSMPNLTGQSCGDSLSATCLAGQVGTIHRPPKQPWMPDRPMNEALVKVDP